MGPLKGDIINDAYSQLRISGITSQPAPEDIALALSRLESMVAEWESRNISTGYTQEDTPGSNTPHNVPRSYWQGLATNLAVRLLADFGKEPTASLLAQATQSLSNISARVATVRPTPYPSRMPVGSGNRAVGRYNTFFNPAVQAPISSGTEVMVQNDVRDFVEHFDSYLNTGETVSSFTISADTGLTIVSSSLTTPDVNYRIKAIGTSTPANDPWLKLTIVATTSTGRIETRVKNFQVTA